MFAPPGEPTKTDTSPIIEGIKGYSCTLYKDYLIFYGGISNGEVVSNPFVWNLKEERREENVRGMDLSIWPRFGHSASCNESKNAIFFLGGKASEGKLGYRGFSVYDNLAHSVSVNSTMKFLESEDGLTWFFFPGRAGPVCSSPVSIWQDDKLYAYQANHENGNFGELHYCEMNQSSNENSFRHSEMSEKKWQKLDEPAGNMKLHWPSGITIWIQNRLYLFTENVDHRPVKRPSSCEFIDDVYVLDMSQERPKWERILSSGEAPGTLSNILMIEANGVIYIFASSHKGREEPKPVLWAYDTNEKKWKKAKDIGTLIFRPNQRAVIYKGQLLIIDWDYGNELVQIQRQNLSDIQFASSPSDKDICKENPENFIHGAKKLYEKRLFSDIIFEVDGEEIPAHKAPLAYHSDYFMKMFTSGMSESHSAKISIPNMKSHIFKAILQYIYCNEVELDEQLALDLTPVADEYLLKGLKEICEKYLCKKLRKDNAIDLLILADRHEIVDLKKACLLILKNLDEKEELAKLPNSLLVELLRLKTSDSQQKRKSENEEK